MYKSIIVLFAVCAQIALAAYCAEVKNNNGSQRAVLCAPKNQRICYCVRNTQTATIQGIAGGDIKLFSSTDCKGNYATLGPNSKATKAQWVNSFSIGRSGISSSYTSFGCAAWY